MCPIVRVCVYACVVRCTSERELTMFVHTVPEVDEHIEHPPAEQTDQTKFPPGNYIILSRGNRGNQRERIR